MRATFAKNAWRRMATRPHLLPSRSRLGPPPDTNIQLPTCAVRPCTRDQRRVTSRLFCVDISPRPSNLNSFALPLLTLPLASLAFTLYSPSRFARLHALLAFTLRSSLKTSSSRSCSHVTTRTLVQR